MDEPPEIVASISAKKKGKAVRRELGVNDADKDNANTAMDQSSATDTDWALAHEGSQQQQQVNAPSGREGRVNEGPSSSGPRHTRQESTKSPPRKQLETSSSPRNSERHSGRQVLWVRQGPKAAKPVFNGDDDGLQVGRPRGNSGEQADSGDITRHPFRSHDRVAAGSSSSVEFIAGFSSDDSCIHVTSDDTGVPRTSADTGVHGTSDDDAGFPPALQSGEASVHALRDKGKDPVLLPPQIENEEPPDTIRIDAGLFNRLLHSMGLHKWPSDRHGHTWSDSFRCEMRWRIDNGDFATQDGQIYERIYHELNVLRGYFKDADTPKLKELRGFSFAKQDSYLRSKWKDFDRTYASIDSQIEELCRRLSDSKSEAGAASQARAVEELSKCVMPLLAQALQQAWTLGGAQGDEIYPDIMSDGLYTKTTLSILKRIAAWVIKLDIALMREFEALIAVGSSTQVLDEELHELRRHLNRFSVSMALGLRELTRREELAELARRRERKEKAELEFARKTREARERFRAMQILDDEVEFGASQDCPIDLTKAQPTLGDYSEDVPSFHELASGSRYGSAGDSRRDDTPPAIQRRFGSEEEEFIISESRETKPDFAFVAETLGRTVEEIEQFVEIFKEYGRNWANLANLPANPRWENRA